MDIQRINSKNEQGLKLISLEIVSKPSQPEMHDEVEESFESPFIPVYSSPETTAGSMQVIEDESKTFSTFLR